MITTKKLGIVYKIMPKHQNCYSNTAC